MKNFTFIILLSFLLSIPAAPLFAQQYEPYQGNTADPSLQTITLKDGTVLKGRLVEVINNLYVIETQHMGEVEIYANDLVSITSGNAVPPAPPSNQGTYVPPASNQGIAAAIPSFGQGNNPFAAMENPGQMQQIQQQLIADPGFNSGIQEIMKDPQLMNLLSDESLLQDIMSMDQEKIQSNPKIQQLMQNPKMQRLIEQAGEKIAPQMTP